MASNEEICKAELNNEEYLMYEEYSKNINDAMYAARKDEAMAFAEWILQSAYHKESCWYLYKDMSGEIYTTEQLYTIFKQQNS